MKKTQKIKALISDFSVSDKIVRKAIEEFPSNAKKEDKKEILSLLKKKRPELFARWHLEVATEYM